MDHVEATDRLAAEVETFAASLLTGDLATPVPTCPGWDVRKVAKHIGTVHRWVAEMVRTGATERLDPRTLDLGLPGDDDGYPSWVLAGGRALVDTLRGPSGDQAVWTWGADHHVRFWSRRMLHETVVHRADVEISLGRTPVIDATQAVDGIDEHLANLPSAASFSPGITELRGTGESIHLHATDIEGEWMIELGPDGYTVGHGHGKGTVAVRATAADLLLLLNRRAPVGDDTRFTRFGDTSVLDHWIEHSALQ